MKFFVLTLLLSLVVVFSATAQSHNPCNPCSKSGMKFHFMDQMSRNTVTFKSEAPLEDIIGTTNQIKGYFSFDPMHPEKGGHGEFKVAVASLNTGIPLRDEHLRSEDWLDAKSYDYMVLHIKELKNVKPVKITKESATYDVTMVAEFTLHGKTKNKEIAGRITYMKESELTKSKLPGDLLAARASFDVNLSDHDVTGPAGMGLIGSKVGETISVEVSLVGTSSADLMAGNPCGGKAQNPCNPCGGKK